jgi:hypothetical protein
MNKQMKPLSHSKHTDLVYLIKESAYPWLYSKLTQILTAGEVHFFASVEMRQTEGRWSAFHDGDFVPYSKIPEADAEFVADDLHYLHTVVRRKIVADPEMTKYADKLLVVPSQEQIFVYHDASGLPKITLAQWGCALPRSRQGFDPLGLIVEERKKTHTPADIAFRWTNGEPATNIRFRFSYKYSVFEKTADAAGIAHLGLLKNGSAFTISDVMEPASFDETVEVVPEQTLYTVVIPFYTSVEVKVIDQLNLPVAGCDIRTLHNGDDRIYSTGEQGEFRIDRILHDNNPLILFLSPDNRLNAEYILKREHNELVFNIYRTVTVQPLITVINKNDGKPVAGHTVKITVGGEEKEYTTGSEGAVRMDAIETPAKLTVTDASDTFNSKDFTVGADSEEFIFTIDLPLILEPHIKTVNRKNNAPVGAYPLKVKIDGNEQELFSNREGILALAEVKQGSKILIVDGNDPFNSAEFTIDAGSEEYVFPVDLPEIFTLHIKVVDREDMTTPVGAYPLKVKIDGNEQELFSNREGLVLLDRMKKDLAIAITDGNNPYNNIEFTTDDGMGEYLFAVDLASKKTVKIRLLNINREIMSNHIIDVIIKGVHYKRTTGDDGSISLPASLFTHGEKIKVEFPVTENDVRKKKKEKKRKKQAETNSTDNLTNK